MRRCGEGKLDLAVAARTARRGFVAQLRCRLYGSRAIWNTVLYHHASHLGSSTQELKGMGSLCSRRAGVFSCGAEGHNHSRSRVGVPPYRSSSGVMRPWIPISFDRFPPGILNHARRSPTQGDQERERRVPRTESLCSAACSRKGQCAGTTLSSRTENRQLVVTRDEAATTPSCMYNTAGHHLKNLPALALG